MDPRSCSHVPTKRKYEKAGFRILYFSCGTGAMPWAGDLYLELLTYKN